MGYSGTSYKVGFSAEDVAEVYRVLDGLPAKIRKRAIRRGLKAGLRLIQAGAKKRMPVDTGTARKSIIVRAWTRKKRGQIAYEVRFNTDKVLANAPDGFFYPAVIEHGSIKLNRPPEEPMRKSYLIDGPAAVRVAVATIGADAMAVIEGGSGGGDTGGDPPEGDSGGVDTAKNKVVRGYTRKDGRFVAAYKRKA